MEIRSHAALKRGDPASIGGRCFTAVLSIALLLIAVGSVGGQESTTATASVAERCIAEFTLRDGAGNSFNSSQLTGRSYLVVVFLGTECPLAKLYARRLQRLAEEYRDRGVYVIGINSNAQDSLADLAAYARSEKITFPLLKDPGAAVADLFDAKRTPEAFILDQRRMVRYRGRIDDQFGVGTSRPNPKRNDLMEALNELLNGSEVSLPHTQALGCMIGRVKKANADGPVTFSKQISRILQRHCVDCHRPGEIAPFSLLEYSEVAGWAATIGEVVAGGRMPPWHANPHFGKFADDRSLPAEEKQMIADWVAAGAPEGDRKELPPARQFLASGWQLPREPDVVIPMSTESFRVPAEGVVGYQYFTVDPGWKEDKWFTAAEIRPGNRTVVHHVMVYAVSKEFIRHVGEKTLHGYTVGYVPGLRVSSYPPGMAKRIPAGSQLVFQVHYSTKGAEQLDCSRVGFVLTEPAKVRYEVITSNIGKASLIIPPRIARYRAEAYSPRTLESSYLLSMTPHMHLRGVAFTYQVQLGSGKFETLLDVPRYDSNWQTTYRLAEPLAMPPNSRVRCTAVFDNSDDNPNNPDSGKTVRWGPQEWDEMMVGYFDAAVLRQ